MSYFSEFGIVLREAGRDLKRSFWSILSYMLSFACVEEIIRKIARQDQTEAGLLELYKVILDNPQV